MAVSSRPKRERKYILTEGTKDPNRQTFLKRVPSYSWEPLFSRPLVCVAPPLCFGPCVSIRLELLISWAPARRPGGPTGASSPPPPQGQLSGNLGRRGFHEDMNSAALLQAGSICQWNVFMANGLPQMRNCFLQIGSPKWRKLRGCFHFEGPLCKDALKRESQRKTKCLQWSKSLCHTT